MTWEDILRIVVDRVKTDPDFINESAHVWNADTGEFSVVGMLEHGPGDEIIDEGQLFLTINEEAV